ncbi:hypothetical protein KC717_00595 [Candidatus Dojkabacteria bacterium]|uniref:Uncharacterized protein n=1 Tax=Candidatus Dojkabacteria bacterium TaxID=2099670 RepID=A0A955L7P2_9BACT|nr:hypothetical protein [Candidatus Dojkabacteria bacterium]
MSNIKQKISKKPLIIIVILAISITLIACFLKKYKKEPYLLDGKLTEEELLSMLSENGFLKTDDTSEIIDYDKANPENIRYLQITHDSSYPLILIDAPGSIIIENLLDKELLRGTFEPYTISNIAFEFDKARKPKDATKSLSIYTKNGLTALGYNTWYTKQYPGEDYPRGERDLTITYILNDHGNVIREMEEFYGMEAVPIN